jgi:hypothetical protein
MSKSVKFTITVIRFVQSATASSSSSLPSDALVIDIVVSWNVSIIGTEQKKINVASRKSSALDDENNYLAVFKILHTLTLF